MALTVAAWAVPARRTAHTVTQPDGTQLELTLQGDEWLHYYTDIHGTPMAQDSATGWWHPAAAPSPLALDNAKARRASRDRLRTKRATNRLATRGTNNKKHGLVILAAFKDKGFSCSDDPQALFRDFFNKEGYSDYGMGGSVRDYFMAQSYGNLEIDFDVVGPVTLSQDMAYYGSNDIYGNDKRPGALVTEAVNAVAPELDFSIYDWDGDGDVDQVFILYAGYGESTTNNKEEIWPHAWTLTDAGFSEKGVSPIMLDGVWIDTYACSNELAGKSGKKIDGIGTACHEFSHCLGLPDAYDTANVSAFGMDCWDVMDYGCYNADCCVPASYTAYERWVCGWTEPTVLDDPCTVTGMRNIDESGECYIIYNRAHEDEFYMLQNIQQTGWNAGAAASGMLIMHVDYDSQAWYDNTVNTDKSHQRMTPVCADNKWTVATLKGDLWPYGAKDSLTDTSTPAAILYNMNDDLRPRLGRPITKIEHQDGLISFEFNMSHATEVRPIEATCGTGTAYDLMGRQADANSRGIHIIGGKKVVK